MAISSETVIALIWTFVTWDSLFLGIRIYILVSAPRLNPASITSEICIGLSFITYLIQASMTTVYHATLIRYRDDESIPESLGMPPERLVTMFKSQLAEVELYILSLWLVKGSFLALYWDIFRAFDTRMKKVLMFTACFTVASWIGNFLLPLVYCRPLTTVWAIEGHCTSFRSNVGTILPWITNMVSDFLVIIIPISVLRTLKLRKSERIAIGFLISLGCLTMGAATLRFAYVTIRNQAGSAGSPDLITRAQIFSYTEGCMAIWAACLPAGRVLLARRRRRLEATSVALRNVRARREGETPPKIFKQSTFGVESTTALTSVAGEEERINSREREGREWERREWERREWERREGGERGGRGL